MDGFSRSTPSSPGHTTTLASGTPSKLYLSTSSIGSRHETSFSARMSSRDFSEQIRHLEDEGSKLLAATNTLGDSLIGTPSLGRSPFNKQVGFSTSAASYRQNSSSLSALADITEDQKTISQLSMDDSRMSPGGYPSMHYFTPRDNLDAQTREADRLQRELQSGGSSSRHGMTSAGLLSSLELPASTSYKTSSPPKYNTGLTSNGLSLSSRPSNDLPNSSVLERQVREAQEEVSDLRIRLREALRLSEEQKSQFRGTIDDLRSQLQNALQNKEQFMEQRQRENASQDASIIRLQSSLEQYEKANRVQEEALLEMNRKLETLQKEQSMTDTLIASIRSTLLDREARRGRPYYDKEPITRQGPTMLAHSLERCLHEQELDLDTKQRRMNETVVELEQLRATSEERQQALMKDHQKRVSDLSEQHEKEISAAMERSTHARKQTTSLQEQINMIQQQSEQTVTMKTGIIHDLESKVDSLQRELSATRSAWDDKREALELAIDQVQKELALVKSERDEAVRVRAAVESRHDDLQKAITRLENEIKKKKVPTATLR